MLDQTKIASGATQALSARFDRLVEDLRTQHCEEVQIVDADQARRPEIVDRALAKCLIYPSHTSKINPQDFLTNETMRIMAQRA